MLLLEKSQLITLRNLSHKIIQVQNCHLAKGRIRHWCTLSHPRRSNQGSEDSFLVCLVALAWVSSLHIPDLPATITWANSLKETFHSLRSSRISMTLLFHFCTRKKKENLHTVGPNPMLQLDTIPCQPSSLQCKKCCKSPVSLAMTRIPGRTWTKHSPCDSMWTFSSLSLLYWSFPQSHSLRNNTFNWLPSSFSLMCLYYKVRVSSREFIIT